MKGTEWWGQISHRIIDIRRWWCDRICIRQLRRINHSMSLITRARRSMYERSRNPTALIVIFNLSTALNPMWYNSLFSSRSHLSQSKWPLSPSKWDLCNKCSLYSTIRGRSSNMRANKSTKCGLPSHLRIWEESISRWITNTKKNLSFH